MSEDKYHVGFHNKVKALDTDVEYDVFHVCKSSNGKVIAFAVSSDYANLIVESLNQRTDSESND
jgi:hypothetical protein